LNELKNLNKEINFIFSSSATVYGDPKIWPITESEPI
jgi:UDP-glucose 4-epimerase